MIGNNDNIRWIGTSSDTYITVRFQDENAVIFYFTKSFLNEIKNDYKDFFDKKDNKYKLMVGFDKEDKKLLFGIRKKSSKYTSALTLKTKEDDFQGKNKKMTNKTLRDFIAKNVEKDKFKLVEYDSNLEDETLVIEVYLDNPIYY